MEKFEEIAGSVVDSLYNYLQRRAKRIERRRIKKELRRKSLEIQTFSGKITQANIGLLDNCPVETELDKRVQEYVKENSRVHSKRFFGKLYQDSLVNMQVLGLSWDITIDSSENNPVCRLERSFTYYIYPQDFLLIYKDLKQMGYDAVGALGFQIESTLVDLGARRRFDAEIKRGIVSGRITLTGPTGHKGEYRFDPRKKECGLEIVSVDRSEKFHSDSYHWGDYTRISEWIDANKHEEKTWIDK